MFRTFRQRGRKHQAGLTLVETLVAGSISLIASGGMLALMAGTLGSGSQAIKMVRLAHEMRSAMQIMTRELRRANYHENYANCFGNDNCRADAGIDGYIKSISIDGGASGDCFWFWYDGEPGDFGATAASDEPVRGFRQVVDDAGIGVFQMTTVRAAAPNCNAAVTDTSWTNITDPSVYDISAFQVSSAGLDFDEDGDIDIVGSYTRTFSTSGSSLTVNRIRVTMTGQLVDGGILPDWMDGDDTPSLTLQDFVRVRNDIPSP